MIYNMNNELNRYGLECDYINLFEKDDKKKVEIVDPFLKLIY